MNDMTDFTRQVAAALKDAERHVDEPAGLADRLISGAGTTRSAPPSRPRWIAPLLAAAAVIALVAGVLLATSGHHRSPATVQPTPTVTPSLSVTTPVPTSQTSATSHAPDPNAGLPVGTAVPAGFAAISAQFRDPADGYAIGNAPCSAPRGYCATLVRTEDGGASWVALPVPSGLTSVEDQGSTDGGSCGDNGTIYGPCVDRVTFADARHGYLWSFHSFYVTSDGGATWSDEASRAIRLVASDGHLLRLTPVHDCSSGCAGRLDVGTVGSSSWHSVEPAGSAPGLFTSELVTAGPAVYFLSGPVAESTAAGRLYRSIDGGQNWSALPAVDCSGQVSLSGALDGSLAITCGDATTATVRVIRLGETQYSVAVPTPHASDPNGSPTLQVTADSGGRLWCFVQEQSTAPWTEWSSTDDGTSWNRVGQADPWTPQGGGFGYRLSSSLWSDSVQVTTSDGQSFATHPFR